MISVGDIYVYEQTGEIIEICDITCAPSYRYYSYQKTYRFIGFQISMKPTTKGPICFTSDWLLKNCYKKVGTL